MSKPVKISTVLTRAAKWIDEHGLAKGYHWRYRNGHPLRDTGGTFVEHVPVAIEKGCKACTWGGIYIGSYSPGMTHEELADVANDASEYVRVVLGTSRWSIPDWNDKKDRTKEEVVQALKDAAKAARKDGK